MADQAIDYAALAKQAGAVAPADGLLTPGNIDLSNRPRVKNPDGSTSTVRSMSFEQDGKEVLVPTVVDGRVVSNDAAIAHYKKTGEHLGIFTTPAAATAFAQQLHESEAAKLNAPVGVDYAALAKQAGAVSSTPAAGPSAGTWEDRGIGGAVWHPASGVTERDRQDNTLAGMPPEFAALSGLAIGRAVGAPALTAAARAVAGVKAIAGQALPQVKYEVTKSALEAVGVPRVLSIPVALMVSGYKKPGKVASTVPSDVSPPGVDRYLPNASGYVPPEAPPPVAAAAPTEFQTAQAARASSLPDQKALNDAALAARRSAYAASQTSAPAAAAEPIVAASGKMQLTAAEMKEFTRLVSKGTPLPDALEQVKAMRDLASRLGGPSAAEAAQTISKRRYKS